LIISKGHIVAEDSPAVLGSRLRGGQRIAVQVRGDAAQLPGTFADIPGVNFLAAESELIEADRGDHVVGFELETAPGEDYRPEIARALIEAGYDLLEIRQSGMSLEDIFLRLVREESEPDSQSKAEPRVDDKNSTASSQQEGEDA
jgi:ABC-2 type transport system ATP-binding protein